MTPLIKEALLFILTYLIEHENKKYHKMINDWSYSGSDEQAAFLEWDQKGTSLLERLKNE